MSRISFQDVICRRLAACLVVAVLLGGGLLAAEETPTGPGETLREGAAEAEDYRLIELLLRDGIEPAALERIQVFLETYPGSARAGALQRRAGEILLRGGDAAEAAAAFRASLDADPEAPEALQVRALLGTAERRAGENEPAREQFRLVAADPSASDDLRRQAQVGLVEIAMEAGEFDDASRLLEELTKESEEVRLRLWLGDAYFELRELKAARRTYASLLEDGALLDDDETFRLSRNLALIHYHFRDFEPAVEVLSELRELRPGDPEVTGALAWSFYRLERYAEAYDLLKAVEPEPPQASSRELLLQARAAKVARRFDDAESQLRALLARDPEEDLAAQAHHELAGIALAQGETRAGVEHLLAFSGFIGVVRDSALARLQAGDIQLEQMEDPASAARTFLELAADPDARWIADRALLRASQAQMAGANHAGAISTLTRLVSDHTGSPTRSHAYLILGRAEEILGDLENAAASYRTVVEGDADPALKQEARFRLGRTQARRRIWDDAIASFADYLANEPGGDRVEAAQMSLGHAALRAGDPARALAAFQEVLSADPAPSPDRAAQASFFFALALERLSRWDEALAAFGELAQIEAAGPWAVEGAFRAARLHLRLEDPLASVEALLALATAHPDTPYAPQAMWEAAEIQAQSETPDEALETLRRLRDDYPGGDLERQAQDRMEKMLLSANRVREALELIPNFALYDPASFVTAERLLVRAQDQGESGKTTRSRKTYAEVLAQFPGSAEAAAAAMSLGDEAYRGGDLEGARRLFLAVAVNPSAGAERATALFLLGHIEFNDARHAAAADYYRQCLDAGPEPEMAARAHFLRGSALRRLGEVESSLDEVARFVELLPDRGQMVDEQIQAGLWLQKGGRYPGALRAFGALLPGVRETDLEGEVHYYLAETHELAGETDRALLEYLRVAYLSGTGAWSLTARFRAGRIYEDRGRFTEAIRLYQGIAENHAGSEQGEYAARKVRELQETEEGRP